MPKIKIKTPAATNPTAGLTQANPALISDAPAAWRIVALIGLLNIEKHRDGCFNLSNSGGSVESDNSRYSGVNLAR
jgi:hypothetical protein